MKTQSTKLIRIYLSNMIVIILDAFQVLGVIID
jgi:hypothetical protein